MREARVLITPAMAPLKAGGSVGGSSVAKESGSMAGEDRWRDPDGSSSVNAVSFGFVATAILVSMFLFMALFEHFLRPRAVGGDSTTVGDRSGRRRGLRFWGWRRRGDGADLEANKLCFPSPEMSVYAKGVSVLMPGQDVPTYIAHPVPPPAAPCPCQPERVSWPSHRPFPYPSPSSSSNSGTNPS
ncbi:multidrug resistance protein [Rhynchospora pubera]|uniref:Multidrug resistance protein n=1 Tax=Rhynchospora pubera TaxID=906938 RepID=A0AAV8GBQ4_9POAL|nr:multidrug resistance protein [Rhynchospora pubera]